MEGRILYASADAESRSRRIEVISRHHPAVAGASSAGEALLCSIRETPSLVIADSSLDTDLVALCNGLRDHPATASTPLMILLAGSRPAFDLCCNATVWMAEPVDDKLLLAMIDALSDQSGAQRQRELETAFRAVQEELAQREQVEEELRRSNRDLAEFARVISHDLQEPLRSVYQFAQRLQRESGDQWTPAAREYLEWVIAGATRMSRMINDLLTYCLADKREPDAPVRMDAVIENAMAALRPRMEEGQAQVILDAMPEVMGNRNLLMQLFQNLLGNAVKYARPGEPPRIHVGCRKLDRRWEFSISDNGIGISPRYHERIFRIFKRLHGHEIPGTGVGLALCRKVVERHGGKIRVESETGTGATFRFTLPGVPDADERQAGLGGEDRGLQRRD